MLVKFFKHGNTTNPTGGRSGGGGAVKDYLLGKDGKPRDGAKLVRGNADITTEIINASKNKKIYTSGVISFSESENPSDQEKQAIIDSFEETLFNGLDKDQYSGYWVEHQDKNRTELHFVFANTELTTGKALPVYFHAIDLPLVDSWAKVTIDKYNYIDPNDPQHQRDLAPTTVFDKDKVNEFEQAHDPKKPTNEQLKEIITNQLLAEIDSNPTIKSRADIVKTLQGMGHEVTRQGKTENKKGKADKAQDFISIKNPSGGQNLKLKGALFSPDFTRKDLPRYKEQRIADYKAEHAQRIAGYQADLATQLQKRKDYLQKRFPLDRKPVDNDLTRKLAEIQRTGETKYTQAQATLAQYETATLAPDELEQFTALTHDDLVIKQQEQLQVISDIEYKIKSGDDLTPQDETAYNQAKAFTNSLDNIIEQQRQAQALAEQQREEQARLQAEQELKDNIQSQLEFMLDTVGEILPPDIYSRWQSLTDTQLADYLTDKQRRGQELLDKAHFNILTPDELVNDKTIKDVIVTINDITASRERIEQHNAQLEDMTAYPPKMLPDEQLSQWQALDNNILAHNKALYEQRANDLFNKVSQDNILLTPQQVSEFKQYKDVIFSLDDITAQREQAKIKFDNQIKLQLDTIANHVAIPYKGNDRKAWDLLTNTELQKEKTFLEKELYSHIDKAQYKILTPDALDDILDTKNAIATINDITKSHATPPKQSQDQSAPITPSHEIKATSERVSNDHSTRLAQAQAIVANFDKLVKDNAEKLKNATISDRKTKFEQAKKEFNNHVASKSRFSGKGWETKKAELQLAKDQAELSLSKADGSPRYHITGGRGVKFIDFKVEAEKRIDKSVINNVQQAREIIAQVNADIEKEQLQLKQSQELTQQIIREQIQDTNKGR